MYTITPSLILNLDLLYKEIELHYQKMLNLSIYLRG